jgi:hypothetical protein
MSDRPRTSVNIADFQGLVLAADPRDLPDGAAQNQVNARSERPGELTIRPGYRKVTFEDD